jgi:hypothetical protein
LPRSWRRAESPAVRDLVRNRIVGREPGDGFLPKRPELARISRR